MKPFIIALALAAITGCSAVSGKIADSAPKSMLPAELILGDKLSWPPRPEELSWGDVSDGLQMGTWPNPPRCEGYLSCLQIPIFCVIRNASDRPVRYCDYALGTWDTLVILARLEGADTWMKLNMKDDLKLYRGSAPDKSNIHDLLPGKKIGKRDYTFCINLGNYVWPQPLCENTAVEVKVVQPLSGFGIVNNVWEGTVKSQVMKIGAQYLQMAGCLLSSTSKEELIEEYVAAGLALKDTTGVPDDWGHRFATDFTGLTPAGQRFQNARNEIIRRGKKIVPLLIQFLKEEVPKNRPKDKHDISPSFTKKVIDILVKIRDPRPAQLFLRILEGYNGKATKHENFAALSGLEKLTCCCFRKLSPHTVPYSDTIEHRNAREDSPAFRYKQAAKLYRKWLAGEGKDPKRWLPLARKRARQILASDDLNAIYCVASFLGPGFTAMPWPDDYLWRDDDPAGTLARLAELISGFEKKDDKYYHKGKEKPVSIYNWIHFITRYGPLARPYSKMLIRHQKEYPGSWTGYLALGRVGGRKIMEYLFNCLGKLKDVDCLRDCRNGIDCQIGRRMKSDDERRDRWEANKDKYDED